MIGGRALEAWKLLQEPLALTKKKNKEKQHKSNTKEDKRT
jgi:hypothetical protein